MKKFIVTAAMAAITVTQTMAGGLVPKYNSFHDRPFLYPLETVSFTFDEAVRVSYDASLTIISEDNTIQLTTARVQVDQYNYTDKDGNPKAEGVVIFLFDKTLLPKGKKYHCKVPQDCIFSYGEPSRRIDELDVDFNIPEDLGETTFRDIYEGEVIKTCQSVWVYWGTETKALGEPEWELFREEELIGKYPAHVGWDWDLGQAHVDFGETLKFDSGVNYTLRLPYGSVSSLYRDDIVNREVGIHFVGGYGKPEPPLQYNKCKWQSSQPEILDVVNFTYDVPVEVKPGAKIYLFEDNSTIVKEAEPFINTMINCFVMSAEFGGFHLDNEHRYTLVIPEGTVTDNEGRESIMQTEDLSQSGIGEIFGGEDHNQLYDLYGHKVSTPQRGTVYIRSGNKIIW